MAANFEEPSANLRQDLNTEVTRRFPNVDDTLTTDFKRDGEELKAEVTAYIGTKLQTLLFEYKKPLGGKAHWYCSYDSTEFN